MAEKVKVIEEAQIAPLQSSTDESTPAPTTSLPLTYFDVIWVVMPPVKRLFFFEFHHSTQHFMESVIPNIKHSLSLALQRYYPFAGHLITAPTNLDDPNSIIIPQISYSNGDSVTLTVAVSDADFEYLSGYHARDVTEFFPLVPALIADSELKSPLIALQITLFPNSGISVGITNSHAVADGKITTQFVKYWASICKFGAENNPLVLSQSSLPFFDRSVVKDPKGLDKLYMKQMREFEESLKSFQVANKFTPVASVEKVRSTFVLGRAEIEKLKQWVTTNINNRSSSTSTAFHASTFVVVCAYTWVCWAKCVCDVERTFFGFAVDCRDRLDPPLPKFYFGNCIMGFPVQVNMSDLIGDEGVVVAAELIGTKIHSLSQKKLMDEEAETFVSDFSSVIRSGANGLSVAGSPRFKVYETDFGWGRPKKVEVVSIEDSGAISLSESRDDGNGGVEVGLVLGKTEMDCFGSLFEETLKRIVA